MSFIEKASDYIHNLFGKNDEMYLSKCTDLIYETAYKELGIRKVIGLLASSFVNTDIKVYENHKEKKGHLYYKLNVAPNINSNKYDFYFKLITQLVRHQEALVVEINKDLFVADSFSKTKYAFKNYFFENVVIDDYQLRDTFYMRDVYYFSLNDERLSALMNSIESNYNEIISTLKNSFVRDKMRKMIVSMDSTNNLKNGEENNLQKLINELIAPFIEGKRSVLSLPKGFHLEELDSKNTSVNDNTVSQLQASEKEILEEVASIFNIPIDLIYGNKNELKEQEKLYMTNAFKPLTILFCSEINKKTFSEKQYLNGNYVKADLITTKFTNWLEEADSIDKAFRCGFSHNTLLTKFGEEQLDEEWANKSYVTKNYMTAEGGEESE